VPLDAGWLELCRTPARRALTNSLLTWTVRVLQSYDTDPVRNMINPSIQFEVHPSSGVPIYRQLMDQVRAMIASGQLADGDMLPSVRQMADELQVNMMTVSKAWSRLEVEGVLERVRGTGMRVTSGVASGPLKQRKADLKPMVEPMVTRGQQLGLTDGQILDVVKSVLKERKQ
jgi:GntR family transcriptional regulator